MDQLVALADVSDWWTDEVRGAFVPVGFYSRGSGAHAVVSVGADALRIGRRHDIDVSSLRVGGEDRAHESVDVTTDGIGDERAARVYGHAEDRPDGAGSGKPSANLRIGGVSAPDVYGGDSPADYRGAGSASTGADVARDSAAGIALDSLARKIHGRLAGVDQGVEMT